MPQHSVAVRGKLAGFGRVSLLPWEPRDRTQFLMLGSSGLYQLSQSHWPSLKTKSLTEPGAKLARLAGHQGSLSVSAPWCWGSRPGMPSIRALWIRTQVVFLTQQAFYPLSHLPCPSPHFISQGGGVRCPVLLAAMLFGRGLPGGVWGLIGLFCKGVMWVVLG